MPQAAVPVVRLRAEHAGLAEGGGRQHRGAHGRPQHVVVRGCVVGLCGCLLQLRAGGGCLRDKDENCAPVALLVDAAADVPHAARIWAQHGGKLGGGRARVSDVRAEAAHEARRPVRAHAALSAQRAGAATARTLGILVDDLLEERLHRAQAAGDAFGAFPQEEEEEETEGRGREAKTGSLAPRERGAEN